jgi:hypothetical protein
MGSISPFDRLHEHHVRVALWHNKEVWIWLTESSINEVVTYTGSQSWDCACTRSWAYLHRARHWNTCHFLSFCHQLASISSSPCFCVYKISLSPLCSSAWALPYWPSGSKRISHVQVSIFSTDDFLKSRCVIGVIVKGFLFEKLNQTGCIE